MKTIITCIALLMLSFSVSAEELLPDTKYEVKVDQAAYERVFIACVSAFKGPEKTTFNDLDEAIKQCELAARKIAMRSKYSSGDTVWQVTAIPIEDKK